MLPMKFFDQDAITLAKALLGKVLRHRQQNIWLSAMIIETEAYYLEDKGSHASLGYTAKRQALFMPPGTLYLYYARGGDSLNISCQGAGNAVLIKSGIVYCDDEKNQERIFKQILANNPSKNPQRPRLLEKCCSGQTLLCKSLNIKVREWDKQLFQVNRLQIDEVGYQPTAIIQTTRLGIPLGRDEHLPYRFIDKRYAMRCSKNPLTKRCCYNVIV